jgi:hypothetical protein
MAHHLPVRLLEWSKYAHLQSWAAQIFIRAHVPFEDATTTSLVCHSLRCAGSDACGRLKGLIKPPSTGDLTARHPGTNATQSSLQLCRAETAFFQVGRKLVEYLVRVPDEARCAYLHRRRAR